MAKKAKKPAAKKAKPAKVARGKAAKKKAGKAGVAPIRRTPKNQPLPGMEDVKIRPLTDVCGSIADVRESLNNLKADEKGALQTACRLMQKHDVSVYKAHGVELTLVAGDVKVRARLVDDDQDGGDNAPAEPDGDQELANEGNQGGDSDPADV